MEFKWLLFLYSLNFPKPGPAYCKKEFLVDFSPGSIPDLPWKPGQDMLRWSGMWKGKEGKQSQEWLQTSSHFMHSRSFPYSLRERGRKLFFILYDLVPAKHVKAYSLAVRSSLEDVAKGLPFSQTKRATDPRFSLREEEKLRENREQERCQKDLESYRKALGLARGSFWFRNLIASQTPRTSVKLKKSPTPPSIFRASSECLRNFSPHIWHVELRLLQIAVQKA